MSADLVPVLSLDEARRLTERIRATANNFVEARDKLARLIREAQEGRVWEPLGFRSWTEYLADVFSNEPLRLSRDERRQIVGQLSDEGVSTRAIAPIVGTTHKTVVKDLQVVPEVPPAPASAPTIATDSGVTIIEGRHVNIATGETHKPKPITGTDGKTYPRPAREPQKPRRRPITDSFWEATYDLARKTESLDRLTTDDRFTANRQAIADKNLTTLKTTASTLARVLAVLQNNSEEV